VLGALVMYIMSMASLFKLRATEPNLERPFRAPLYPLFPAIAIVCGVVCLAAVVYFNQLLALIFLGLMAVCYAYFRLTAAQREAAPHDAMLASAAE
jgi:ethanolamine permease